VRPEASAACVVQLARGRDARPRHGHGRKLGYGRGRARRAFEMQETQFEEIGARTSMPSSTWWEGRCRTALRGREWEARRQWSLPFAAGSGAAARVRCQGRFFIADVTTAPPRGGRRMIGGRVATAGGARSCRSPPPGPRKKCWKATRAAAAWQKSYCGSPSDPETGSRVGLAAGR